jgi:UDPglucose 6-dehydrogenase
VIEVNTRQQTVLIDKAREVLGSLKGKRCAVWGLAFKPDTDDIREAPALHLIHALLAEGASIVAHDPVVQWLPMYSSLSPDLFHIVADPYAAIADVDVLFLVTEWSEYRTIDIERMTDLVGNGVIVDGRNIWAKIDFTGTDVAYLGVGRQSNVKNVREAYAVELAG